MDAGGRATQDAKAEGTENLAWRSRKQKIDRMNRMHKIVESMLFGRIAI